MFFESFPLDLLIHLTQVPDFRPAAAKDCRQPDYADKFHPRGMHASHPETGSPPFPRPEHVIPALLKN